MNDYSEPILQKCCLFAFGLMLLIFVIICDVVLDWLDSIREEWKATKNAAR